MSEDRIVYVCGCEWPECVVNNTNDPWSWTEEDVGKRCACCNDPVQAINIDALIRERDDLKRRLDAMDAAYEHARIELVKARLDNAEGIVYRAFRAAIDQKDGE